MNFIYYVLVTLFLILCAFLVLLVLIVWWTMFSGRKQGELPGQHEAGPAETPAPRREDESGPDQRL